MARLRADFPDFDLAWATDGGTQISPSSAEKATGAVVNERFPARKFNWLIDAANKWLKVAMAGTFGNFGAASGPVNANCICWSSIHNVWVQISAASTSTYYSADGVNWTSGATKTGTNPQRKTGERDNTGRVMFGDQSSQIQYISDPTTGSFTVVSPGFGSGGDAIAIRTKDSSDFIMAANSVIAEVMTASDVTSAWTSHTTPAVFVDLSYVSGNTWLGITAAGAIYASTNDGTSWVSQGDASTAHASSTWYSIDIDPGTGQLVAAATLTASPYDVEFAYSTDFGATWIASTMSTSFEALSGSGAPPQPYALGGQVWMAVSNENGATDRFGVFFSFDGGVTWQLAARTDFNAVSPIGIAQIGFNGYQWLGCTQGGIVTKGTPVNLP